MIQANELRIGNYVYDDFNEIHRVESVQSNRLIEYNRSGDPNVIISKLDGSDDFYVSDYVNPIHLTPDILEKCGFEKQVFDDGDYYYSLRLSDHKYCNLSILSGDRDVFLFPYDNIRYKYLHQLQNAYYSLTGKELDVTI